MSIGRRFALVAVGFATLLLFAQASAFAGKAPGLQRIARSLVAGGAPGAVVYVRTPSGARFATAGLAQLRPRVPIRVADRYRIGSITKTFVATVVVQLAAEGKLGLDDSVEKWLPGVVPNGAAITLRQLLHHSGGLFDYADDPAFLAQAHANLSRHWSPIELLSFAFAHQPLFAPGSSLAYSNTGYILLGLVVERVTGEPLGRALNERVFAVAGADEALVAAASDWLDTGRRPAQHAYAVRNGDRPRRGHPRLARRGARDRKRASRSGRDGELRPGASGRPVRGRSCCVVLALS